MSDFNKTEAQKKAVSEIVRSRASNVMLFGGARSGKTTLAVYILLVRACKTKSNHAIVRGTFNSVKNSIWLDTLPKVMAMAFPNLTAQWDRTNYRIILPNGSTVRIFGLDAADKLEKILGLEFSTVLVEECNQVPWLAVQRIKSRLAEKNSLSKKVFYTQNPTKTTSAYYQVFEQGIDPTDGVAFPPEDRLDYLSIRINPESNLSNLDPNFLKMLEKLPKKERLRFLQGEYDNENTGAAVYAFSDDHISEEAKKLPGTIWVGSDFNVLYNSDVLCSQHAHGLYVWDNQQLAGDTFKKADGLKAKGAVGASVVCDSTGKARRTSGISDHEILRQAGFNVVVFQNPAVTDKINNLNRCFTLGLIKIHPRCKKLIRDLKQLEWRKDGELDQKTDPSLSHLVDSLAYLCYRLYPLQDFSKYKISSQGRF